jgi:hypothetical protein
MKQVVFLALVPFVLPPRDGRLITSFLSILPPMGGGGVSSGKSRSSLALFAILYTASAPNLHFRSSPAPCGWRARFLPPFLFVNMSSATLKSVAKFMSIPCRPATIAIELMPTLMIDDAEPKCVPSGCTIRTKNIGAILCHFTDL